MQCKVCSKEFNGLQYKKYCTPECRKLGQIILKANQRGHEWKLTPDQYYTLVEQDCYYCKQDKATGIDRLNNDIGYVIGNCVPACQMCNFMKWQHSHDKFISKVLEIAKTHS